jgi:mRNA interferase RelE/StbE
MPEGGERPDAPEAGTEEVRSPDPVMYSRRARRNLHEDLPLEVAVAATETIQRAIARNPYRVGKPLDQPFDGYHSARRGTYRIIYRVNEPKRVVEIHSIRPRRNAYRA